MLGFGDLKDMAKAKDHAPQHQPTKKDYSRGLIIIIKKAPPIAGERL
jgi:hypothetical protein